METKSYNQNNAIDPAQPEGQQGNEEEINFSEFVNQLPEEFREEITEALAALLNYIHSDEGTTAIIQKLQEDGEGDLSKTIGILALQTMDIADGEHGWSDSAKVFAGYFAVSEICLIGREAQIIDIPKEQEQDIFKQAAQNYLHSLIKSKPTRQERDKEAMRIQQEVEPLMKMQQERESKPSGGLLE